jgi:hypothetical protein
MSAYADALWESQTVYTVDCRTGETRRRRMPTETPEDRAWDVPSRAEAEEDLR